MRDDILEASVRVLRKEGLLRFTTPRVAAAAGVSVGSLYQYFPNKQALLYALHLRIIQDTWQAVQRILDRPGLSHARKIRRIAGHFFRVEAKDADELGSALGELEAFFDGQPEKEALEREVLRRFAELAPRSPFRVALLVTVIESVGKSLASRKLTRRQRDRWARATAEMVTWYLGAHP